ncbi:MAG: ABC transporter permease [Anaerolineae bacterium]|nr:ABC transporter permease [Anaerolineae bacterium]MDW8070050.1 ABC transporter permease [Anaerolineae bacterium]
MEREIELHPGKVSAAARPTEPKLAGRPRSLTYDALRRLWRDRAAVVSAAFLLFMIIVSLAAPFIAPMDPNATNLPKRLLPPGSPGHLLGTDELGRDMLSRLIWGGRVSLLVGFIAVLVAMSAGVVVGLLAGYFGGWVDSVIMRLIDILMAFPSLLLAIAVVASLGPGLTNAMLAVSIVGIPYYARIVRGSVLSLRNQEFVQAARVIGASDLRIIVYHILANSLAPLIVAATLDVGWMIMAAAGLSFLGLGAQPPTAEWGVMLSAGRQQIRNAPHISILPGLMIFLVVLALNFLGDGVRDAMDPRLRQ